VFHRDRRGHYWIWVLPELLFLDFEAAAIEARVFDRDLVPRWLTRPQRNGGYKFSVADLEAVLTTSPHLVSSDTPPPEDDAVPG
jgi:hypothetical protein